MIYYFASRINDNTHSGKFKIGASNRKKYGNAEEFRYLGIVDGKFAYGTEPGDTLNLPDIASLDLKGLADRIAMTYAAATPSLYTAQLPEMEARLRTLSEMTTTPEPAPVILPVPGWEEPRYGATWFGPTVTNGWATPTAINLLIDMGVRSIRYPIKRSMCYSGGIISNWVVNHLVSIAQTCIARNVMFVIDDHTYSAMDNAEIGTFWADISMKIQNILGYTPLVSLELQNEPGGGSTNWPTYATGVQSTLTTIRDAGVLYSCIVSCGNWSKPSTLIRAFDELTAVGGAAHVDPLGRTIYAWHDYWGKNSNPAMTGNDQSPYVDGQINIAARYQPVLDAAALHNVQVICTEIGGGGGSPGWMPPYNGVGKDGQTLELELQTWLHTQPAQLSGLMLWMGGRAGATYRHKISAGTPYTPVDQMRSDFWKAIDTF